MTASSPTLAVLGSGAWGTALSLLLARNGVKVYLWGRDAAHQACLKKSRQHAAALPGIFFPENLAVVESLPAALEHAQDVLIAVPSAGFTEVLTRLAAFKKPLRIAWATKGLDPVTGDFLHVALQRLLPQVKAFSAISGPSFAKEVAEQKNTAVAFAASDESFKMALQRYFTSEHFKMIECNDFIGLGICGTFKNVLALIIGAADGLLLGANTRAAILTQGLQEMYDLSLAAGGQAKTVYGLGGLGDLVLTATDDQSRNRRFGQALACYHSLELAQKVVKQAVESKQNITHLFSLSKKHAIKLPLLEGMHQLLFQKQLTQASMEEYFQMLFS